MEDIILIGAGGHAKSIIDSIEKSHQYRIIGFTDVKPVKKYKKYGYLGDDSVLYKYFEKGIKYAFVTLGFMGDKKNPRALLYNKIKQIGYKIPVIIDPSAEVASDAEIGEGTFIGKKCIINAATKIGKMCIINTCAVIEHDNIIGDFSHISVQTTLCGNVITGENVFVGANTVILQEKNIGKNSLIGAGSVILRDILPFEKVYGVVN